MDLTNGKDRGGGNPFFPQETAQYTVMVDRCRESNNRKGLAYIVSFEVLTSSVPYVKPGEIYDWYVSMATPEKVDFAIPDVRGFIQAIFKLVTPEQKQTYNVPPEGEKTGSKYNAIFKASYSDKQPLRGQKIRLNTEMNKAKTFTKHFFHPIA
jgi:hypothetical protein